MTTTQWKAFNRAGLSEYMTEGANPRHTDKPDGNPECTCDETRADLRFTQKQWEAFKQAGQLKNLTEPRVAAIPLERVRSLDMSSLAPEQFGWLSDARWA
ncbi:hypothetical protein HED63_24865 [Ochrobactrum cytisi]|nr:hypothetical protein [Brucella cytisi]